MQHPFLKTTQHRNTKEHEILNLKSCDMSQTSSLTKRLINPIPLRFKIIKFEISPHQLML